MDNLNCPYCNVSIIYKHNHEQIPPHLPKEECDKLVKDCKIWGCGNPFQLHNGKLIKCGWI